MDKLSSDKVSQVLAQVGPALRGLSEDNQALLKENEELHTKLATYEKRERVEKIASEMRRKGLNPESSHQELVDQLMAREDLDTVQAAVEFSAPQMKLAAVSDRPGNPSNAEQAFIAAILDASAGR